MHVLKVIAVVAVTLSAVVHAVDRSEPFIADENSAPATAAVTTPTRAPPQAQARQPQPTEPSSQPAAPSRQPSQPVALSQATGQTIKSDATPEQRTVGARDPMLKVAAAGPAQPVVRSESVNVTATPTTGGTAELAEQRAKKTATPSLLDVKVKGTTVTISPAGVIRTRNPDVDVDVMKVAQMIAQFVQTIRKVVEAGKEQSKASAPKKAIGTKAHRIRAMKAEDDDVEAKAESKPKKDKEKKEKKAKAAEEEEDDEESETDEDDSDGARELPINGELVDDAKPFARKLPFRVRREPIRGASSVGNVDFEGSPAPILMQLQAVSSTIPKSDFAPDAYRFSVAMKGAPNFVVELPAL